MNAQLKFSVEDYITQARFLQRLLHCIKMNGNQWMLETVDKVHSIF